MVTRSLVHIIYILSMYMSLLAYVFDGSPDDMHTLSEQSRQTHLYTYVLI